MSGGGGSMVADGGGAALADAGAVAGALAAADALAPGLGVLPIASGSGCDDAPGLAECDADGTVAVATLAVAPGLDETLGGVVVVCVGWAVAGATPRPPSSRVATKNAAPPPMARSASQIPTPPPFRFRI